MITHEARGGRREARRFLIGAVLAVGVVASACGKKGPPLPPLNLVPDRPAPVTARVVDGSVYLQTTIPTKNAGAPGAVNIGRVEAYGVTVAARAYPPSDLQFFKVAQPVGRVNVKPPPDPNAEIDPMEPPPPDDRPAPGAPIVIAEKLTPANTQPQITPDTRESPDASAPYVLEVPAAEVPTSPDAVPAGGASVASSGGAGLPAGPPNGIDAAFVSELPQLGTLSMPGAAASAPPAARAPALRVTSRIYSLRGVSRKGRPGTASPRLVVPLVDPPPPPVSPEATFSETAITITWKAPELPASAAPLKYNVYGPDPGTPPKPLNAAPLDALTLDRPGVEMDVERCFRVRSVRQDGDAAIESAPSAPACVTPHDIFPPAAPKALAAVAGAGAINLIWDANTEPDLAGYVVLRGDAPDGTLQPLTPQPIRDTRYADTTAQPGVQYVYAVVAVDKKGNRSEPSNKVTETGR